MTTKRSITQAKWRSNTDRRKIEAYLPAALVEQLDAVVVAGSYRGRAEALAALIREHAERVQAPAGPALHVERAYDRVRCECATAKGGRCQGETLVMIRKRVASGEVLEFGACARHEHNFTPFPPLLNAPRS